MLNMYRTRPLINNYPFNQNSGALLSKRNYINRKLDEIENKLIDLGWLEQKFTESDEYDNESVESAGAILPYRQTVNDRLDLYESVIESHMGCQPDETYVPSQPQQYTPVQESVSENFKKSFADIFG